MKQQQPKCPKCERLIDPSLDACPKCGHSFALGIGELERLAFSRAPAFSPECGTIGGEEGMTLREYYAAKFAAAWVPVLAARRNEAGYSDETALIEANRLGRLQASMMIMEDLEK